MGRSTIAEKLARSLFDGTRGVAGDGGDQQQGGAGHSGHSGKVTLTGYREVRIDREF